MARHEIFLSRRGREAARQTRQGRLAWKNPEHPNPKNPRTWWYPDAMRTTIDKAGRVVIPAAIRERLGLIPGAELAISVDDLGVRLERVARGPRLVRVGRRLVARPSAAPDARPAVDVAAIVEDERNRWP